VNHKLLKRMSRPPRVKCKDMVYFPVGMGNKNIPVGMEVETQGLMNSDGTIKISYDGTEYLVFLTDLCEA